MHGLIVAQINSAQVVMFLEKAQFSPTQISSFRVVFDNAQCHRGVDCKLVRLPPYSCTLNPIENCFQSLKAHIKRKLSEHGPVVAMEGQTLVTARRQLLLHLSPDRLKEVTGASTLNAFYHVLTVKATDTARLEDT